MMDIDTRLRAARGRGKTETEAATEVFQTLKRRGHPEAPPATVSDGGGGIREAMVEVYGKAPECSGRGRPAAGARRRCRDGRKSSSKRWGWAGREATKRPAPVSVQNILSHAKPETTQIYAKIVNRISQNLAGKLVELLGG